MANETMNHDLLIATEKTPHQAVSSPMTDIIIDPSGKPLPGTNWDDMKKLRKAGPCSNTRNTFINGATVYILNGRIDATTKSTHPVAGPGQRSGMFRGDISAMRGSPDLKKEGRFVMRTSDLTRHNCMPPTGPENCYGDIKVNLLAPDLSAALRDQIKKLCEITVFSGSCSHGRAIPNGAQLEVVKSGNGTETLTFAVTRVDTTIAPPGNAKCQFPGEHTKWRATYGNRVLKEQKGVDAFTVDVPGFTSPAITGILPAVKWMIDTLSGPGLLTVTATSCASTRNAIVRCYPNGKLSVNWADEKAQFERIFGRIKEAITMVEYIGRILNGGSAGKMTLEFLPSGSELAFECEFLERKNHLVGAKWKATFGFNPLAKLDFKWPIPIHVFLGPFGAVARAAQWILEAAGLTGMFYVGFFFQFIAVGVIERDQEGVFTPGFECSIEFVPNCSLELYRGSPSDYSRKVSCTLGVTFSLKLRIVPNDRGNAIAKGVLSGEIQLSFTIEYEKKGSQPKKLVDYKPEWAKWPKTEEAQKIGEFNIL